MMKKLWFMLAICVCLWTSCSDGGSEDPANPNPKPEEVVTPEITISSDILTNGLTFDTTQGEKSVSFSTNVDWTLSIASTTGGSTWCKASATNGSKGSANVKFTVDEHTDYDDRSVSVTIKAGTASKTFTITQKCADALLITTNKYDVAQDGATIEVEVKANIDYQVAISETAKSWISEVQSKSRALTTRKHSFTIAASEDTEKREGEITFKSGDKVETVKVYQAGGAILLLSQNEFSVGNAGETISVDIKSNIEYGVQMPDVDWITDEASSRGMSSHTLNYVIAPNEGYDARAAEIIFYDKNSDLKDTLKVVQAQKDAIVISQKKYDVKAEGETIEVKLSANVDFEITMPEVDWIEQVESRALTNHTLYFKVAENEGEESRSATILFTNNDSNLTDSVIINQRESPKGSYENGVLTINTAGTLKDFLGDDYLDITSLKIVGPINGSDIYNLRRMLAASSFKDGNTGKLTDLDLSEAILVEGGYYLDKYIYITGEECFSSDNMIGCDMFERCTNLQNIILPKGITSIEESAFNKCKSLESITIGEGVTAIKQYAFYECESLSSINIPNSVTTIGTWAFNGCKKLKEVTIGNGLTFIGKEAFSYTSVESVYIEDLSAWCKIEFNDTASKPDGKLYLNNEELTELVVPNDVTEIKDFAFYSNKSLTKVSLGSNVKSIGKEAFYSCSSLVSIELLSDSLTSIGNEAFSSCNSLESIKLSDNLTSIGNYAFYWCRSLTSVIIPDKVTSIGIEAFQECTSLVNVTLGNGITKIGEKAFMKSRLASLKIPKNVTTIERLAFYYTNKDECYSYAVVPPSLKNQTFSDSVYGKLYVPAGSLDAYKASDWVNYFEEIIEME